MDLNFSRDPRAHIIDDIKDLRRCVPYESTKAEIEVPHVRHLLCSLAVSLRIPTLNGSDRSPIQPAATMFSQKCISVVDCQLVSEIPLVFRGFDDQMVN